MKSAHSAALQGRAKTNANNGERQNCTDDPRDVQARAVDCVGEQLNVEARFLSALWHDPRAGLSAAIEHGLDDLSLFLDGFHREVFAVLMTTALSGQAEPDSLETVVAVLSRVTGRGVDVAEVRDVLHCESSGAGAFNYAALIANPDPSLSERTRARLLAYLCPSRATAPKIRIRRVA